MNTSHFRNSLFSLIGLGALAAYVLACASFSPDGTKVLFPSIDPQTGKFTVALYDRGKRTTRTLFTLPQAPDNDFVYSPQWTPDGKAAVIVWPEEENGLRVLHLPVDGNGVARLFRVEGGKDAGQALVVPPAIIGRHLFLAGETLARLDLETGEVVTNAACTNMYLYTAGRPTRAYYMSGADKEESVEIGLLQPDTFARTALLTLAKKDFGEFYPFGAFSPDGARIVIAQELEEQRNLVIFRGKIKEQTIRLGSRTNAPALGNLCWAPSGGTIYALSLREPPDGKGRQFSVAEIPLLGGPLRETPVFRMDSGGGDGLLFCPIALAPDGKTIAVSSTYLFRDKPDAEHAAENLGLFLVDLTSPQRKVTRVPIPLPPRLKSGSG